MMFIIGFVLGALGAHWYYNKDNKDDGNNYV
jgi:hypothetical protein